MEGTSMAQEQFAYDAGWYGDTRRADRRQGDSLLAAAAKGALAGALGTVVVTLGMQRGPQLMERYGLADQGELTASHAEPPTEKLASQVSETVLAQPLDAEMKQAAGQAVHWGYGITWGALYGLAQRELQWP